MKIRTGFVSNSSTSSFIIVGWEYQQFRDKFKDHIQDIIFDLYKIYGVDYTKECLTSLLENIGDVEGLTEDKIAEIAKDICELDVKTFNDKYKDVEFSTYGKKDSVISLFTEKYFLSYDEYCLPVNIIIDDADSYYVALSRKEADTTVIFPISSITEINDSNNCKSVDVFKKYCDGDLDLNIIFTVLDC